MVKGVGCGVKGKGCGEEKKIYVVVHVIYFDPLDRVRIRVTATKPGLFEVIEFICKGIFSHPHPTPIPYTLYPTYNSGFQNRYQLEIEFGFKNLLAIVQAPKF